MDFTNVVHLWAAVGVICFIVAFVKLCKKIWANHRELMDQLSRKGFK